MNVTWTYLFVASSILGSTPSGPTILNDYQKALQAARAKQQPLLVILEDPSLPDGRLETLASPSSTELIELLQHYEVCRIDINSERGASVARAFEAERYPYSAITDASCEYVVFRGVGQFSESAWANMLTDYKDGGPIEKVTVNKPVLDASPRRLFSHADVDSAIAAAKEAGRPVLAYVTMPGCLFCEKMKAETLEDPVVNQTLTEQYESVLVDQQVDPDWVAEKGIRLFPATLILGPDGNVIQRMEGYVSSHELIDRLDSSNSQMFTEY